MILENSMADMKKHRKERRAREMIQYFFILNVCGTIYPSLGLVESQSQAFIQTDNELRYMGDGVLPVLSSDPEYIAPVEGSFSSSPITFDPGYLDFEEQPVGMPHMRQVTVQNLDLDKSLHLLSISGSTQHFHCSFFQDKKVSPGGNTTFEVVFLARQEGNVENTLFIHTSKGSYRYHVFGVGVPNPYRVRPILGAKVPINSSFSPLIHMHNPHSSTLQVQEIFTTGGDLHLELPSGEKEASREMWEIPPYETKPIMKASFLGRIENNHTAFIRIKTNKEEGDNFLVLPVEVEVSSTPGIYSPSEMLDFNILRTQDDPKVLKLNLINSGPKPAYITNITAHPSNPALSIDFRPTQLKPDVLNPTPVAHISFNASKAKSPKHWSGSIRIHTKQKQYELTIPYQASIYKGSLGYDKNSTLFFTGDSPTHNLTRDLHITNTYNFTLVIYNVSLGTEMVDYFAVEAFQSPVFIPPQESTSVVTLRFNAKGNILHFKSQLTLHTNASDFFIPISVYDGKVRVIHHRPEISKGQLDFGTLGIGEHRSMTFTLRNDNPIDITVTKYITNMIKASVELMGVEEGNGTTLKSSNSEIPSSGNHDPFVLHPFHFAVFNVNLIAPSMEGAVAAEVLIFWKFDIMPRKETKESHIYIPITLQTAAGSLKAMPSKLLMERCFPGRFCHQDLQIHSSFKEYMEVRHVHFSPNDTRFYYVPATKNVPLTPSQDSDIGTIYFDPKRECGEECYVGLPTHTTAGHHWLIGCSLERDVADTDQYLYTRFRQRWQALLNTHSPMINVTMQLDTNKVRGFLFPCQAHLHWPSITRKTRIQFPLTQLGNISLSDLLVENPGDMAVVIQVLPLPYYPNPHTVLDMMRDSLSSDLSDFIDTDDTSAFSFPGFTDGTSNSSELESILGVKPHPKSIAFVLPPRKTKKISVGFQPKDESLRTSLLVIRNNLTIIDAVVVQGQGGRGELRFSNRKPGSLSPLLFDMTEKHLKSCDKKRQNKNIPPNFTVKRTFTARNVGELPFYVHGFSVSKSNCEGYGFKVLDCQGFDLQPNASKKIDIVFTPDFTMSRIRRVLTLHTSLGPAINYTLQATVLPHMLSKCAAALPRPHWEPIVYYSTICIMGFLLCCIFVAAYFEADRIYHLDIFHRRPKVSSSTQTFDKGKQPGVFDLKNIAGVRDNVAYPCPNRTVTQSLGNSKGYATTNGHSETLPPHLLRRTRREPVSRTSRLLAPLRAIWGSVLSWSWASADTSTPPHNGAAANGQKSNGSGSNAGTSSSHRNQQKASATSNDKENHSTTSEKTSQLNKGKQISALSSLWGTLYNLVPSFSSSGKKTTGAESRTGTKGKSDQHSSIEQTSNDASQRKITTDREGSGDRTRSRDNNIDDDVEEEDPPRKETKKSKQKRQLYKLDLKRNKERFQDVDRDETSSTTTESSSCLETDDKNFSTRDTTPDPQPQKTKKVKGKGRRDKNKSADKDEDDNEEDFIIQSKSKAHKKIKVDPKNSFGGNIYRPVTLELPYMTKLEARKENSADQLDPISVAPGHVPGGRPKSSKNKAKTSTDHDTLATLSSSSSSSLAPLSVICPGDDADAPSDPVWDMPATHNLTGDLSQLSLQTEQFIKTSSTIKTSDDLLTPGSRNPTFSSVVSSDHGEVGRKSPIGKYPPTPGGMEHNSPVGSQHPGAIGSKPSPRSTPTTTANTKKSPWQWFGGSSTSVTTAATTTADINSGNSFGLHPVPEDRQPGGLSLDPVDSLGGYQSNIFPGLQDGLGPLNVGSYGQTQQKQQQQQQQQQPSASMLMQLQAERRQRRLEYQQNIHSREDWPGFEVGSTLTSTQSGGLLWDTSSAPPTEAWSTMTDSPQRHPRDTMWGARPEPQTSWAPWGTSTTSDPTTTTQGPSLLDLHSAPEDTAAATAAPNMGRFDPFSTLASIWNPPTTSTLSGGTSWGVQAPPSQDDK